MKRVIEELEVINLIEESYDSDIITLEMPSYHEMEDRPTKGADILALINNQFDQIYRENKMISFLVKEVSSHIK